MTQPETGVFTHMAVALLQLSTVHAIPSEQFRAGPEQVPAPSHVSGFVHHWPSTQGVPLGEFDHAVVDRAGLQS
jgi:hypothetical protein